LQAIEVGPCTRKAGPCLVHFKGCRLTPAQLNTWIEGSTSLWAAVVRIYWMGPTPHKAASKEELVQQLVAAGPPPDGGPLRLQGNPRAFENWLMDELPASFNLQPVGPVWVLNALQLPNPQQQGQQEGQQDQQGQQGVQEQQAAACQQQHGQQQAQRYRYVFSLQPATDLYSYTADRTKRVPDQLSKAAGKLAEALVATGLQLTSGVAVDLGAAPGKL